MEDNKQPARSKHNETVSLQDFMKRADVRLDESLHLTLFLFSELLRHPRPSKNEAGVRDCLSQIAENFGWKTRQDTAGNLAIYVPASKGKEETVPVVLQGHLDIVASPADRDLPRSAEVTRDGDYWIQSAGQKMTLGADNGIGVALAMATLRDPSLKHGPVTILLTTDEETGMSGAQKLDPELLPERGLLVNLDSEEGTEMVCIGCAGAQDIAAKLPIARLPVPEDHACYEVKLTGWPGGHSGCEIHTGNGNPIQTLARLLKQLGPDIRLVSMSGGTARNAIPDEATAVISAPDEAKHLLFAVLTGMAPVLMTEPGGEWSYGLTAEKAGRTRATLLPTEDDGLGVLPQYLQTKLLTIISESPTGPFASAELPHIGELVTLSSNLGTVETDESCVRLGYMLRSADADAAEPLRKNLEKLLGLHGAKIDTGEMTAGWLEDPDKSPAIAAAARAVESVHGRFRYLAYHAGLECGVIVDRRDTLSAVSLGPLILEAHTPRERVSLQSITDEIRIIRHLLENA